MGTCTGKHDSSSKFDKKIWHQVEIAPLPKDFMADFQNTHQSSKGSFISPEKAERLILEFKRFIYLVALAYSESQLTMRSHRRKQVEPSQVVPSPILDRMWRMLILSGYFYE